MGKGLCVGMCQMRVSNSSLQGNEHLQSECYAIQIEDKFICIINDMKIAHEKAFRYVKSKCAHFLCPVWNVLLTRIHFALGCSAINILMARKVRTSLKK